MMGKLWRVDKALEDSEGLRWVCERLAGYDWSKMTGLPSDVDGVRGTRFEVRAKRLGRRRKGRCRRLEHDTYVHPS
jgi:hypothetical protein